jgi:hypothetical protein
LLRLDGRSALQKGRLVIGNSPGRLDPGIRRGFVDFGVEKLGPSVDGPFAEACVKRLR